MSESILGLTGTPLKDLTNEELNTLANSCIYELNIRVLENQKIDVNVGDCFIDNTKEHRKAIYIIKKIDKRKCYTIIEGMHYTIEYDSLDIIGGEYFALKTDILSRLDKLEGFDHKLFENGYKDLEKSLILQWNGYIDNLCNETGIILKK